MSAAFTLDLRGRDVLVVGGGPSAAQRARALLSEGARVHVVSVSLCETLRDLFAAGDVTWAQGPVTQQDVRSSWLVSVHDDGSAGDVSAVAGWAYDAHIWCEGTDATAFTRSDLDSLVSETALSLRATEAGARPGKVVLVGGGPGADDLITVRGRRELARADVVVTDRLAPIGLLRQLGSDAEVIDVGKTPYHHPVPQLEINRILVERARLGQYVVRLKGGDPFMLGRGGEEWIACRSAGVECEIVPGVTSAIAAPAAGLVPVTHRGIASGVLVISGHDEVSPDILSQWPHTIVVLMGMARLEELCTSLVRAGRAPDTPVSVVQKAWTEEQRSVTGTLADIASVVQAHGIGNPAAIVIGDVVHALDAIGPDDITAPDTIT